MVVVMRNSSRRAYIAACKSAFQEAIKGFECARRERGPGNGTMGCIRNRLGPKAAILGSLAIRDTPSTLPKTPAHRRSGPFTKFQPKRYWDGYLKSMFPRVKQLTTNLDLLVTLTCERLCLHRHGPVINHLTDIRRWRLFRCRQVPPPHNSRLLDPIRPEPGI